MASLESNRRAPAACENSMIEIVNNSLPERDSSNLLAIHLAKLISTPSRSPHVLSCVIVNAKNKWEFRKELTTTSRKRKKDQFGLKSLSYGQHAKQLLSQTKDTIWERLPG